jgi:hypothetical protein
MRESFYVTPLGSQVRGQPRTKTHGTARLPDEHHPQGRALFLPQLPSHYTNQGKLNGKNYQEHKLKGGLAGLVSKDVDTRKYPHPSPKKGDKIENYLWNPHRMGSRQEFIESHTEERRGIHPNDHTHHY